MALVKYSGASPYAQTPQNSWFLDNLVLRELKSDPTDTAMVIPTEYDQRPYNLSYELYGTKDYWWVFMVLNMDKIRDPIYDFKAGISIRVPSKTRLMQGG